MAGPIARAPTCALAEITKKAFKSRSLEFDLTKNEISGHSCQKKDRSGSTIGVVGECVTGRLVYKRPPRSIKAIALTVAAESTAIRMISAFTIFVSRSEIKKPAMNPGMR